MILCITHSSDHYTIDIVRNRLKRLGYNRYRFDSDRPGVNYVLEYELNDSSPQLFLKTSSQQISPSDIQAVWYRKLWPLQKPEGLDPFFSEVYHRAYICNTEGNYVFSKVNPHGEWGMLPRDLN